MTPEPNPADPSNPPADPPAGDPPAADPPAANPPASSPPAQEGTDWKAEARKWEQRAKDNATKAKEYDRFAESNKSEVQRAQDAATAAEARAQALVESVARAKIEAALTGVVPDPSALADDLNVSKFLTAEGEVDADALKALRGRYEALAPDNGPRTPQPTPGQGANSTPRSGQITPEALDSMSPEAIMDALDKGLLNDSLGIKQ